VFSLAVCFFLQERESTRGRERERERESTRESEREGERERERERENERVKIIKRITPYYKYMIIKKMYYSLT
jgi:hypothetical protein